nr:3C-like protease [Camellia virus A]
DDTMLLRDDLKASIGSEREVEIVEPEAGAYDNMLEQILPKLENAMIQILCTAKRLRFLGFMVCGTVVLIPAHYLLHFTEDEELVILSHRGIKRVKYYGRNVSLFSNYQDLCLLDLGVSMIPWPDMRKHFISDKQLTSLKSGSGFLLNVSYTQSKMKTMIQLLDNLEKIDSTIDTPSTLYDMNVGESHVVVSGMRYRALTGVGFCGSIILSGDKRMEKKILGIHVAANADHFVGYGEFVTEEMLRSAKFPNNATHLGLAECDLELEPLLCKDKPNLPRAMKLPSKGVLKSQL